MKNTSTYFLPFVFCLLIPAFCYAQKETNKWYFGQHAGLNFNVGAASINNGHINTSEGCSGASDPVTGNLLFYTDGITIWDASNTIMMNGTGLMGHSSGTQSALAVPMPGNEAKYYLFTADAKENNGISGYRYSIIDMAMNSGLGAVTATKNVLLLAPSGEQSCAVKHSNCADIWVMTHDYNGNGYYAFLVTAAGINAPVISNSGTGTSEVGVGQMKFSPDGTKVALADVNSGTVQVSDFNNSTGIVSNSFTIYNGGINNAYGLSFSPDGSRLYLLGGLYCNSIYQYNMLAGTNAAIIVSQTFLGNTNTFSQFQNASDGKLYINQNVNYLGIINNPNVLGAGCGYTSNGQGLGSGNAKHGLPNFIESYFYLSDPCFLRTNVNKTNVTCNGESNGSALVNATGGIPPYTYLWSPGGFTTPGITGLGPGSYTIVVTDSVGNQSTETFAITEPSPLKVSAFSPVNICIGENAILTASASGGTPAYTYVWDSTFTGQSYTVSPAITTTYSVMVKDTNNCTSESKTIIVNINLYPVAGAGEDQEVCAGTAVELNASGGINYSWLPALGLSNSNIANPVATPLRTTSYTVTVSNGFCIGTDIITVTVDPLPIIDITPDLITISIGASTPINVIANGIFEWTPATGLSCNDCPTPTATPQSTTTYTVTVTNYKGCTSTDSLLIVVDCELFVPNAFSPDGNGINEYLFVYSNCITTINFTIYDRWGGKVFETDDPQAGWDGTYNGKALNTAMYVYHLEAELANRKYVSKTGEVFLKR